MKSRTVRVPQELHCRIEEYINKGEYSTMADFTLHALRHTVSTYLGKKKELAELDKTLPGAEKKYKEVFKHMTSIYLTVYEHFSGDLIQINVRVPEGLNGKIQSLTKNEYGFTKKSQFLKVSLACLLSHLDDMDKVIGETIRTDAEEEELISKLLASVAKGIIDRKSTDEVIVDALNQIMSNKS